MRLLSSIPLTSWAYLLELHSWTGAQPGLQSMNIVYVVSVGITDQICFECRCAEPSSLSRLGYD
jgi:hypothetical protein